MRAIINKVLDNPKVIKYHFYLAMLFALLSFISFYNSLLIGFGLFIIGLTLNFIGWILLVLYSLNKKSKPARIVQNDDWF